MTVTSNEESDSDGESDSDEVMICSNIYQDISKYMSELTMQDLCDYEKERKKRIEALEKVKSSLGLVCFSWYDYY